MERIFSSAACGAGRKHFDQQGFGKQIPKGRPAIDGPKHENIAGELSDRLLRRP
jgi:hypothetical protein